MLSHVQTLILEHCEKLEMAIGNLYVVFKGLFPGNGIWDTLILEEQTHAESVAQLRQMAEEGKAVFDEGRVTPDSVEKLIRFIVQIADSARAGKYSAHQAFGVSLDLENSIIEANIFKRFTVSKECVHLLNVLHDGTIRHIGLLKSEVAKNG
jgi:hypothetical protein